MASSLVQDTELNAKVSPTYTEHYFDRHGRSGGPREVWTRNIQLGSGSFGTVWLEECRQLYRVGIPSLWAVKEIRIQAGSGQGLDYNRELEAFAKFSQPKFEPYFVRSYGWYRTDNAVFITMAYCPLGDLQQYLSRPVPEAEAGQITYQLLEGLGHMHDNGFAHHDLKPKECSCRFSRARLESTDNRFRDCQKVTRRSDLPVHHGTGYARLHGTGDDNPPT
ncbi:hypothetical protein VTI74DRAFT_6572 [Chaetomium olivicolor]